MNATSNVTTALMAYAAAEDATRSAHAATRLALREESRAALTNSLFMARLLPLLSTYRPGREHSSFDTLLDYAYEENIGDSYSHFERSNNLITIYLILAEGATFSQSEVSNIADFLSRAGVAFFATPYTLNTIVTRPNGTMEAHREYYRVAVPDGMAIRSAHRPGGGFAQKAYSSLYDALQEAFTPLTGTLSSFPEPII